MKQVIYALTGSGASPPILDRMLERFAQHVRDDLEDIVWNASFQQIPVAEALFQTYQALPEPEQLRLFLSPAFFSALCSVQQVQSDENLAHILGILEEAIEPRSAVPSIDAEFADDAIPEQFLLGDTITVDIGSPLCRRVDPASPVFMTSIEWLTADEARIVANKLSAALAEIDETAPGFARMIRNYTRTVFVRKMAADVPASEQVDTELGAIRLRNVHSDLYSHEQLVDDLIHESTHNFLGTFEYLEFPFVPHGRRTESWLRPVSPWSMRPIQVLPFIHACFVYFAMYNYAELRRVSAKCDSIGLTRVKARQNRYASGFLMPGRLSSYVGTLSLVDPRAVQAIDWLEDIICSRYELAASAASEATSSLEAVA